MKGGEGGGEEGGGVMVMDGGGRRNEREGGVRREASCRQALEAMAQRQWPGARCKEEGVGHEDCRDALGEGRGGVAALAEAPVRE